MTCREFQEILPEIIDGGQTMEQESHWKSCADCSNLVADLTVISQQAMALRATDVPSPRVWNSIEIALREEGLIRQGGGLSVIPSLNRRWSMRWLVPVAAVFLLSFGVVDYYMASKQPASTQMAEVAQPATAISSVDADDSQLLEAVALRAPSMRAAYEANLRDVNAYIRDAEDSARQDPTDEEAQQVVVEAYAQKNMIYEMALERSLR
jgi:hypothetical protein